MHKTAAVPLTLLYALLIVYASLYPFAGWRDQGIGIVAFLGAPFPRFWSGFDVTINVLGYAPLGALLVLVRANARGQHAGVVFALVCASALSLVMETLQGFLPIRVASREDWLLNTTGAWLGALLAYGLVRSGVVQHWSRARMRWLLSDSRGALILLLTWPFALLFPPVVPFGVGQVFERLQAALVSLVNDSPDLQWLPVQAVGLNPMLPWMQSVCVFLGLLIPCLLGLSIIRFWRHKFFFVWGFIALGLMVTGLSSAMSWGPTHAWSWLESPVQLGVLAALLGALLASVGPARLNEVLALFALGVYLVVLNQASEGPYIGQTLQEWEQGRFIRFNGLAQWLGWVWPYASSVYVLSRLGIRNR